MSRLRMIGAGAGAAMLLIVLVAAFFAPGAALRAWLAAAFLWSGVPIGSLALIMMIRIIGGRWGYGLLPILEAGASTLPLSAASFAPILLGMGRLYPWTSQSAPGFKGAWLAPWPFAARTVLLFGGLGVLLHALVRRRGSALRLSSIGLLLLVPMASIVAVDWIVSLDRDFHSSGFGLMALSIQFSVALSVATLILLGRQPDRCATLGALQLTMLLIALYLSFTSYFIIWSGNFAALVGWYVERGQHGWGLAYGVVAGIELAAMLALFFPFVRGSALALRVIAGAVLIAKAIEAAWLVLPGIGPVLSWSTGLFLLAATGLGLVMIVALALVLDRRIAERKPSGA